MKIASSLLVTLLATMTISSVASELSLRGGPHLPGGPSAGPYPSDPSKPIDKVDEWLASQSLNQYGDPEDTAYLGGSPLFDETTGEMKDRYDYLLAKFPKEPWLSSSSSSPADASKEQLSVVDDWLQSESLNEYGDPMDTVYMGGDPLFDGTTGETKDRYEYLLEKFPKKPWLEGNADADADADEEFSILTNQDQNQGDGTESREQGDTTDDPDDIDANTAAQGDTTDDPDANTPAQGQEFDATSSGTRSVGHAMSALSIASSLLLIAIVNL